MTPTEAHRLAAAINHLRPDWPVASIDAFVRANLADRAYRDAAVALAWVATDPTSKTPARVLEAGPWWRASMADGGTVSAVTTRCPEHPTRAAWKCPECAEGATPPPDTWKATVKATLATIDRPREVRPPERPATDLDAVRKRIDQEASA